MFCCCNLKKVVIDSLTHHHTSTTSTDRLDNFKKPHAHSTPTTMSSPTPDTPKPASTAVPGDGIRQVRTTSVFRLINFELYTKPNKIIMGIGIACFAGVFGYIAYMRSKYESLGYYSAVQNDGQEVFTKKESKWET